MAASLACSAHAATPVWTETLKLVHDNPQPGDRFGSQIEVYGNTALIGAFGVDIAAPQDNLGAAYLFDITTGQQLGRMPGSTDPRNLSDIKFDNGLALFGGQTNLNTSAFLYNTQTGQQLSELIPSDPRVDEFGRWLALDGDLALVGGRFQEIVNDDGEVKEVNTDAIYIFDISDPPQPMQTARLTTPPDPVGQRLGPLYGLIAIDGTLMVIPIGTDFDDGDPADRNQGSVLVYDLTDPTNPTFVSQLIASDPADRNFFGASVALSDGKVVVGANTRPNNGQAFLFDVSDPANPVELAKLTASDAVPGGTGPDDFNEFGERVAIDGRYVVVSARGGSAIDATGSAYLYDISNTANIVEIAKLTNSDPNFDDNFGVSVAVVGDTVLVGAADELSTGAAYLFRVPEPMTATGIVMLLLTACTRHRIVER